MYRAILERADASLQSILDENGDGDVVGKTMLDAENLTDAINKASAWAEDSFMDMPNNVYARFPAKFLGVSAFGNKYSLGYASRRYRRGGLHSGQGGFVLYVKEVSEQA